MLSWKNKITVTYLEFTTFQTLVECFNAIENINYPIILMSQLCMRGFQPILLAPFPMLEYCKYEHQNLLLLHQVTQCFMRGQDLQLDIELLFSCISKDQLAYLNDFSGTSVPLKQCSGLCLAMLKKPHGSMITLWLDLCKTCLLNLVLLAGPKQMFFTTD